MSHATTNQVASCNEALYKGLFRQCNFIILSSGDELVLYGNFSVLGLLILRHHSKKPNASDFVVFKFVQAIVR